MPLVNFSTDLTTLRYGSDRPGGGWSGEPWIRSPNPDLPQTVTTEALELFQNFYRANKTTSDFPIRGGAIGLLETPAGRIDRSRIKAFLDSKTKGTIFKLKQRGLQLVNPNMQVPTVVGAFDTALRDFLGLGNESQIADSIPSLETTRYYSPNAGNTLLQTQVQGLGIHIPRHGLSPLLTLPYQSTYEYFVTRNNTETTNRLTLLTTLKINQELITRNTGRFDFSQANNPTILGFANRYSISPLNSQILNYVGGPGSTYGVGFTRINRPTDTTQANEKAQRMYNAFTLTYAQLADQKTRNGTANWSPIMQDFRRTDLPVGKVPVTTPYILSDLWYDEQRYTGRPGGVDHLNRIKYNKSTDIGVDKLNEQSPFYYDTTKQPFWEVPTAVTKDIIKFGFECMSNDEPGKAIGLVFRAYLTNFSDTHQAELSSFKYLGRGETFRTYQGFDRSVSFSFKIAAHSRDEMRPLYKKLNTLISQVYPDYAAGTGLMRGSVVKLTIGDYLYRVSGFIENISVTVPDNYSWEIALDPLDDADMNQLPQILDVQCTFKPIHDFLPARETKLRPFVPLIGSRDSNGGGWLNQAIDDLQNPTPGDEELAGIPIPEDDDSPGSRAGRADARRTARKEARKAKREERRAKRQEKWDRKEAERTQRLADAQSPDTRITLFGQKKLEQMPPQFAVGLAPRKPKRAK